MVMTTQWIARLYFFVRVSDLTPAVRNNLADKLAAGSGHTRAQELEMFNNAFRLSLTGNTPAQVLAWNVAVKASMRDEIKAVITALPQSRYYVVANTDIPAFGWVEGQLLQTDSPTAQVGEVFTWQDALNELLVERGLQVIKPAAPVAPAPVAMPVFVVDPNARVITTRARGLARIPQAARSVASRIVRSPVAATVAAASLIVSTAVIRGEVEMEFLDAVLGLFPVVAAAAILVRYIVEGVKKFAPKSVFAQYPDRLQAGLNAFFWLVLGIAAAYGADGQALDVVQKFTDAFPGLLGLLELVIPVFLSLLATKGVHELAKKTEASPFRGSERGQPI
jgi:hypothetical protein